MKLIVGTWTPVSRALPEAWETLNRTGSAEDAAELAVMRVEDDPLETNVGYGGSLTREGKPELDAAFMEGAQRRIGAVAGIGNFRYPVKIARMVMEKTPHNLLVGAGANQFARDMGCEQRDMAAPEAIQAYETYLREKKMPDCHDTVGVIALCEGHFVCAMSTSGFAFRMPGRVSDSALPADGYFCDDGVGAAVATGVGEDIMRGALSSRAVFYMEQGEPADKAALRAVSDVHSRIRGLGRVAMVAVDAKGRWGGAANHDLFSVSVADDSGVRVVKIPYCFAGTDTPQGQEWRTR